MKRASLNHTYRLVWRDATQAFVAVAENSKACGKKSRAGRALAATVGAFLMSGVHAAVLPTGGVVTEGSGNISQSGSVMTITQASAKLAADWQTFSIGQGNTVNFVQPSVSAVALNRVLGADVSVIQGALNANGQVFIINPNGVLFTPTAQVNVGGLVASTLGMSTADFMAGNYKFEGGSSNAIINQGNITTANGGTIALIAAKITNAGTLTANRGNVLLGAGSKVTLDLGGPVKLQVEQGAIDALIENGGAIKSDGGTVLLTAKAAGDLAASVINHTGIIEAQTLSSGEKGQIYLIGGMDKDRIVVGGKLDAGAPNGGDGGFIETSAATVDIAPGIQVNSLAANGITGQWLIDPYDVLIAASGGNITGATIATALNSTNVTIDTTNTTATGATYATAPTNSSASGDITVNDAIAKTGSSRTTLTLKAHNDININQAITSNSGALNVVFTADQDNNNSGNINFGTSGRVVTNNGNFYAGSVSGSYDTVVASGQNFTMAAGSYINAGRGNLDISVKGNVQLPNNSAQIVTYALSSTYNDGSVDYYRYFNSGQQTYYYYTPYQYLNISTTGGGITSANNNAAVADIVTSVETRLSAGSIGTSGNPLKLSGPNDPYGLSSNATYSSKTFANTAKTLYVTNTGGSSYINEIGVQNYSAVNITVGNQATATQQVNIMGDQGGTGHITLNNNGSGVLALTTGDINTGGVPGVYGTTTSTPVGTNPSVFPTSVSISAPAITFANDSVNTGGSVSYYYQGSGTYYMQNYGMSSYWASFTANAGSMSSSQLNGVADIKAIQAYLTGADIGTSSAPLELGSGSYLNIDNTGGSTFVKVVDNNFSSITLANRKVVGEHHILWSGGDHIDYTTNGSGIILPTISGGNSDGSTFGATTGIDVHNSNRSVSLTANTGYVEFDTNSVNTGSSAFTTSIYQGNTDRNGGKAIYATNAKDGNAEITAGDTTFNIYNSTAGAISDIEIAKGSSSNSSNVLTVNTYQGNVDIRELTADHFKTLNVTLNGSHAAQNVSIDLAGPDDVNFSDSGSLITLDATKVNLSSYNRNWNLQASSRLVQADGTSLGTGNYTLYGGNGLKLNSDILTNGGAINLTGGGATGIALMKSVRIDSNADDINNSTSTGSAGSIQLSGTISGTATGYTLTVDSGSSGNSGNSIYMYSSTGNTGGAYLSGLIMTTKGSTNTNDGTLYLYGNYYLNGNFTSIGNSYLYNSYMTIDTEQGNTGNGGNITFGGYNLYSVYGGSQHTFNTATTAAGMSGGNVDLYGTYAHGTLSGAKFTITTTGGTGGGAGAINLPAISAVNNGYDNSQTFTGGIITLNGNISTERSNVTLNGDVRLASNVIIDTWQSYSASYPTGTAGAVTITGTGVSASTAGKTLTIDTSTNTGANDKNTSNDADPNPAIAHPSSEYWGHNGGSVNIKAGNTGGEYLGTLTITTAKGGTYNNGSNGAITINDVRTTGNQTYTGGSTVVAGNVTSGSTVTLNTVTDGATVSGSGVITASSLLLNGLNTAYNLHGGTGHKVGILAATGASNFNFLNDDVALAIGTVSSVNGISASGLIDIATNSGDITISQNIATTDVTNTAITINAGKSAAGTATGGSIIISSTPTIATGSGGRATLYTGSVSGSTGLTALIGSGSGRFRYNSDEAASNYSAALGSGTYAIYRERPALTVTPTAASSTYGDAVSVAAVTGAVGGYVNGDDATTAGVSGTASFSTAATSNSHAGTYDIVYASGLANTVGYAIADATGSTGEYSITARTLIATLSNTGVTKTYDGTTASNLVPTYAFSGLASVDTAATLSNTGAVYDSVNVANATKVTVSGLTISSITGNGLASDYMLDATSKDIAATITKVRLLYVADAATMSAGTTVPAVSGTVTGFVAGENAANATSGTLAFNTPATSSSSAGQYAINGSGLTAANYDFSQAAGNATALTIGATLLPPQAAIQVVQTAAAPVVIAQTMPLTVPLNTGGAMIGGLEMIPVKSDTLAGETIMPTKGDVGSDTPVLAQVGEQQGGTDIMKVFVVNGGVNLPSAAQTQQQEQQEGR